jgi:glucosyl-3-phosphoglycerate synthase
MPAPVANERPPEPSALARRKQRLATTISVCLPARDEEGTIGPIVDAVRRCLIADLALVDEIVVVDDGSDDQTAAVARAAGARVVTEADVLPAHGPGSGKGNAMWKSLYATTGDLICWLDADVRNFDPAFVTGLVAPLLYEPDIVFVKGYYERPYRGEPTGGGRVTELVARPLLSLLFPKLADIVQPLSGEYAGRREALTRVPFVEGWGVEVGLLIDLAERYGRAALAQVDLGVREHRNRPLEDLAPQALAVLAVALRRAGLLELEGPFVELVRPQRDAVPVEVRERPPMASVAEYHDRTLS